MKVRPKKSVRTTAVQLITKSSTNVKSHIMVHDFQLKRQGKGKGKEKKELESKIEIREANSRYEQRRFQRVPGRIEERPFSVSVPGVVIPSVNHLRNRTWCTAPNHLCSRTWSTPPNHLRSMTWSTPPIGIRFRHRVTNIELLQLLHNAGQCILGRDGRRAHGEDEGEE